MKNCAFNPNATTPAIDAICINVTGSTHSNLTLDGCVLYLWRSNIVFQNVATTGSWTITNCCFIPDGNTGLFGSSINLQDLGGTYTNNRISCSTNISSALVKWVEATPNLTLASANFSGNIARFGLHSGFLLGASGTGNIASINMLNNTVVTCIGIEGGISFQQCGRVTLTTCNFYGNGGTSGAALNVPFATFRPLVTFYLYDCIFAGLSGFGQSACVATTLAGTNMPSALLINAYGCDLGKGNGGTLVAHTQGDFIVFNSSTLGADYQIQVLANNCKTTGTPIANFRVDVTLQPFLGDHIDGGNYAAYQNYDQTANDHRLFTPQGTNKYDSTIYHNASPSERVTPFSASYKARSALKLGTIDSGTTRTIGIWIYKSAVGDGAAYNGAQPRLILRRNDSIGVTGIDTVLATYSAGTGSWNQLTATVPVAGSASSDGAFEVFVDCDGTAGWINIDDWTSV